MSLYRMYCDARRHRIRAAAGRRQVGLVGPGQALGFGDAGRELLPTNRGCDRIVQVGIARLGVDQISAVPCLASDRTLSLTARASRSRVPCSRTSARRNMRPIWARHVAPRPVIVEPYTWCLTAPTQTAPRRRRFHHPVDRASPCRDAWRHQPASLPLTIALNFAGYFAIGARPSYLPSPIAFALALRPQAVARNLGAYFHTLGRNQMRAIWILQPVNRTHLQCALPYWSSP